MARSFDEILPKSHPFRGLEKKSTLGKVASCVRHGTHGWAMYVRVRNDATPEDIYERAVRVRSFGWSYAPVPASVRACVKHGTPERATSPTRCIARRRSGGCVRMIGLTHLRLVLSHLPWSVDGLRVRTRCAASGHPR